MNISLIQKHNVTGPKYTSYPTVPYWDDSFSAESWTNSVTHTFAENHGEGISLYIHLPFCESMCTFCGCTKRITKNHNVEGPYIQAILKEWGMYCRLLNEKPLIKAIHLGGGTPTFFASQNLEDLINGIFSRGRKAAECDMSFEGHPNNTTSKHLQKLFDLGFRRVSFGVQDYAEKVQVAIHRIQPFDNVAKVTVAAREIGYSSIGHDLIFGLPFQTTENIIDTIEKTVSLLPSRIAFYSYAHVPWIKGNDQRGFDAADLPMEDEKRMLYATGKTLLEKHGYREVGMDHFALASDTLFTASDESTLHQNCMGYSATKTQMRIGLGVSAISDSWYGFAQNVENLEDYHQLIEWNQLPLFKGYALTDEDLIIRKHMLNLMCRFETSWSQDNLYFDEIHEVLKELKQMEKDKLLEISCDSIKITSAGKPFVRNICMAFDLRMKRAMPEPPLFSMTV